MISKNALLLFGEEQIVPIRAVPFVTGGHMAPRCLASILSDPYLGLRAFVLGPDGTARPMSPKDWNQFKAQLSTSGHDGPDLIDSTTLGVLPSLTFVYWVPLWRTYEELFINDREALTHASPGEQDNCMLRPCANIPKALVKLVFEGFIPPSGSDDADPPLPSAEVPPSPEIELLATRDQLLAAYQVWRA